MEVGLAGVRGHTVISRVGVVALFALVPAPVLHPKMEDSNVLERRTRSNPATPNHVVCLANAHIRIYSLQGFNSRIIRKCKLNKSYRLIYRRKKGRRHRFFHLCSYWLVLVFQQLMNKLYLFIFTMTSVVVVLFTWFLNSRWAWMPTGSGVCSLC